MKQKAFQEAEYVKWLTWSSFLRETIYSRGCPQMIIVLLSRYWSTLSCLQTLLSIFSKFFVLFEKSIHSIKLKRLFHWSGHMVAATLYDSVVLKQSYIGDCFLWNFAVIVPKRSFHKCSAFKMLPGSLVTGLNSVLTPVLMTPYWMPV